MSNRRLLQKHAEQRDEFREPVIGIYRARRVAALTALRNFRLAELLVSTH